MTGPARTPLPTPQAPGDGRPPRARAGQASDSHHPGDAALGFSGRCWERTGVQKDEDISENPSRREIRLSRDPGGHVLHPDEP